MSEKRERYRQILLDLLQQWAAYTPVNLSEAEGQIIADLQRDHFQLVRLGWQGDAFVHNTVFHFDIKEDGKIWIQANWTDTDIAADLVSRGVEKNDIVLGFQPPRYRPYTGYATA
ncbi:FdxN element excision controlling factor protein [Fibrisoma limi BUZ 3]|uniref:FdxN element excision controlling factor protein n=1 Tax=Fibrisoma limi BUZ 3 TaxID=1185876 RepID=I2GRV3_9BACT|nr:XisI protein [Fibrisoma limi]CCH56631.1 FdxN element excision controlling factor protein [Fibrisoma limi BUZ 3]